MFADVVCECLGTDAVLSKLIHYDVTSFYQLLLQVRCHACNFRSIHNLLIHQGDIEFEIILTLSSQIGLGIHVMRTESDGTTNLIRGQMLKGIGFNLLSC